MTEREGLSRRRLLEAGAAAAGGVVLAGWRPPLGWAQVGCAPPSRLPAGLEPYQARFVNWSKEIDVDGLWTCAPRDADDLVRLANWARREGYRLRARGAMHGWSPLAITPRTTCDDRILMIDTTRHLTGMRMLSGDSAAVHVQAGARLDALHAFLEDHGLEVVPVPTTGEPTVAGALAIGAHGASLPAAVEVVRSGQTYGSLSNLVVRLTAVVWDPRRDRYVLRTFDRTDPESAALLVHVGRALITSVTLRVSRNRRLRCQSFTDIPAAELFATPAGSGPRSLGAFVARSGSVEAILFPFTERPWLKVWSVAPTKPAGSREVTQPYNYPFVANLPEPVTDLIDEIVSGNGEATPAFGEASFAAADSSLTALDLRDLWGKSKNVLLYVKPETLRVADFGHVVITRRRDLQRAVSQFIRFHRRLVEAYRARGLYPANAPMNIRVTGLDRPAHSGVHGAVPALLSPTVPRRDRPDWDAALWINVTYFPGTAGEGEFYSELQRFLFRNYRGWATVRPEWSKHWAYTERGSWTSGRIMRRRFPRLFSAGRQGAWDAARGTLDRLDPYRVFSNDLIDRLL